MAPTVIWLFLILLISEQSSVIVSKPSEQKEQKIFHDLKKPYLRAILSSGKEYYVENSQCPLGVWSTTLSSDPVECICVNGVYLVSENLCDSDFEIITGNEHCFDFHEKNIRKFYPLLDKEGFSATTISSFPHNSAYVSIMKQKGLSLEFNEPHKYLFQLNTDFQILAYQHYHDKSNLLDCVHPTNRTKKISMTQTILKDDCINHISNAGGKVCYNQFTPSLELSIGKMYDSAGREIETGETYSGICSTTNSENIRRKRESLKPRNYHPKTDSQTKTKCTNMLSDVMPRMNPYNVGRAVQIRPVNYSLELQETDRNSSLKTLQDQTKRILSQIANFEVKKSPLPKLSIPEYKFVQLSKKVVNSVCPEEFVPLKIINFMLRVFRLYYITTQHKYPYFYTTEKSQFLRITEALQKCAKKAPKIQFLLNDSCPAIPIRGVKVGKREYFIGVNLTDMPKEIIFDPAAVEASLETVWKLLAVVHYHCLDYFQYTFDYVEYFIMYERLFKKPSMLLKWQHPVRSASLFSFFLKRYDLRQFMSSIDICLRAAFFHSKNENWLVKPYHLYPLRSYIDKDYTEGIDSSFEIEPKQRIKRSTRTNSIWDDQAKCLQSVQDILPLTKSFPDCTIST